MWWHAASAFFSEQPAPLLLNGPMAITLSRWGGGVKFPIGEFTQKICHLLISGIHCGGFADDLWSGWL